MPPPILSKPAAWLKQHQERLIDAGLLLVALRAPGLLPGGPACPPLGLVAGLVAFALCSSTKAHLIDGRWPRYLALLPGYAAAAAGTVALHLFWLNLPGRLAIFAPLWLALTVAIRLPWARFGAVALRHLRERRLDLPLAEAALVGGWAWAVPRWSQLPAFSPAGLAGLAAGWVALGYFTRAQLPARPAVAHLLAAGLLAAAWAGLWRATAGPGVTTAALAFGTWLAAGLAGFRLAARRWAADPATGVNEVARWVALVAVAGFLFHPFLRPGLHGTGDALYYATFLADALTQFRAGVFPVFVGQSEFQFNGSVIPIRVAPGFQYLGGLVDLLSARTLGPIAVQNCLIVLVALAASLSAYASLRALRAPAGAAWALAFLYLTCPGTLGLAFNTDLYMSWLTTPFVPAALALGLNAFARGGPARYAALGATLAVPFWLHAPIAIWLTLVSAGLQAVRFAVRRPDLAAARAEIVAGAAAFLAIAAYPLVSALVYPPDPTIAASGTLVVLPNHVLQQLNETFPASWLPLSHAGRVLTDFQLGYALLGAGLVAAVGRWRGLPPERLALFAAAAGLLLLLVPVPWLTGRLWSLVPSAILTATNIWVMQRLYVVLAAVLAAAVALRLTAGPSRALAVALGLGCLWSGAEAVKFLQGSWAATSAESFSTRPLRPENITLTRYSYGLFAEKPAYFTHGTTDPLLENRLLRDDLRTEIAGNFTAAARAAGTPPPVLHLGLEADRLETPRLTRLEAGRRYLLELVLPADLPTLEGTLLIDGRHLQRVYGLPDYGESRSFGLGGDHNPYLPLHTTAPDGDDVRVRFVPRDLAQTASLANRLGVRISAYDTAALPVQVRGWLPYSAVVRAPEPGWLETPRMYQAEYRATVNGQPVTLMRSFQGLAAIPVPAGESRVELTFIPPGGLSGAFWLSLGALGLALAAAVAVLVRALRPPLRP